MARCVALLSFLVFAVGIPTAASAQYVDRDDDVRFEEEFDTDEFMITPRARAIAVPGFMLDIWLDEHANHWQDGQPNYSFGGEFVWRQGGDFEIGVGIDWAELSMPSQFWLEKDDPAVDADFTTVDLQMLSVVFSTYWFWDVQAWLSPYLGGGIGPGIIFGEILKYNPSPGTDCRAQAEQGTIGADACFGENGDPDLENDFEAPEKEDAVPPVVPVINLTAGLRFNIARYGVFKLEIGFHDYFFAGAALGVQW